MGEPRPSRPAKPGYTGGEIVPNVIIEPINITSMKSVISKQNGRTLHSGSLQECQWFVEVFELKGLVDIK